MSFIEHYESFERRRKKVVCLEFFSGMQETLATIASLPFLERGANGEAYSIPHLPFPFVR